TVVLVELLGGQLWSDAIESTGPDSEKLEQIPASRDPAGGLARRGIVLRHSSGLCLRLLEQQVAGDSGVPLGRLGVTLAQRGRELPDPFAQASRHPLDLVRVARVQADRVFLHPGLEAGRRLSHQVLPT